MGKRTSQRPTAAAEGDRLRQWLLGTMTALFVARVLFPGESAAQGDGLPVVMLWIALAVFWLLWAIGRPRWQVRFGRIDAAVILLVLWHAIAAVWATTHGSPRPAINMLWQWVGMGLAFLMARQLILRQSEARAVVAVMIALAVALSGYGLYQYFYELPQTRAAYEADPERMIREAGLSFAPDSAQRKVFEIRLHSSEPLATFALTNSLAGYLAPWLVVLAGVGIVRGDSSRRPQDVGGDSSRRPQDVGDDSRRRPQDVGGDSSRRPEHVGDDSSRRQKPASETIADGSRLLQCGCCAVPIVACWWLTNSRSTYIATAVGGVLLVWMLCREKGLRLGWKLPAGVAAAGAVLVAGAIAVGGLHRTVLGEASKSLGYRLEYWQSTMRMIGDHPFLGCGPGNFQHEYTAYKLPQASEEVADPHNFLLEVWATAGTPAGLALLAVLVGFVWALRSSAEQAPPLNGEGPEGRAVNVYVLGGGAIGFLLSIPLGWLSEAPPGLAAVWLGLPLAAACVLLLCGWISHGRLPAWLPAIGVAVLLVNLLAAGGIGFPSVAGSLWLLLAVGLTSQQPRTPPRGARVAALILTALLAGACYFSAYAPVLRCGSEMRLARDELIRHNASRAEKHLAAAAGADPLAAGPQREMARIAFARWLHDPSDERFRRFEHANSRALALAPHSAVAWEAAGDYYLAAFHKTGRTAAIDRAIHNYRRAVNLYPNSGLQRAKLAVAYAEAGRNGDFRRQADQALLLDRQTPHEDKKLPDELRKRLERK